MDGATMPVTAASYFAYWGKARPSNDSQAEHHLLPYHCLDVAAVGDAYLSGTPDLCAFLALHLGAPVADAQRWVVYWLALHDLGKFAESFQGQRPDLWLRLQVATPQRSYTERHDTLGFSLWRSRLCQTALSERWFGGLENDHEDGLAHWAGAATGHHGQPPAAPANLAPITWSFRPEDLDAATAFARDATHLILPPPFANWVAAVDPELFSAVSARVSWWMAGLAVLADWIGSNTGFFSYCDEPRWSLKDYWPHAQRMAQRALHACGVLPPERPAERSFHALFPSIPAPSPLQRWACDTSPTRGPQIHLLEDVTGAGKTEAAITLMHRLIAGGEANGFFIGLPTMATANAMYDRVSKVFPELFGSDASLVLAHGRKRLVESFAASVIVPGQPESDARQADDTATSRCTAWLADHNKRALLAAGGVGTVDQALLGALQSRHQSLRLLGLFRKVLVVDEVHACDAYMQGVLEVLLRLHAEAGGSAVLLSATLPQRMKRDLLAAFASGCRARAPKLTEQAYPLVTSWSAADSALSETPLAARAEVCRQISVRYESNRAALIEGVVANLQEGRCAAWICNTIGDALALRQAFSLHVPQECITLFHARFALGDRLHLEEQVISLFGPGSSPTQRRGQLLIATQVAEQSLDVDFDLVVSDLAPIDRLIQRAGRLRRHVRDTCGARLHRQGERDGRGEPWLWVHGPAWAEQPEANWLSKDMRGTAHVYPHHAQAWFTARELQEGTLRMPDDARRLVEVVFGDEEDAPPGLQGNANRAEGQLYGDRSLAQLNCINPDVGYERRGSDWMADSSAPSRLGEDTQEVLLARWVGDRIEPWASHEVERLAWAYSSLRVPRRLIDSAEPPTSAARQEALNSAIERLPGAGRWVVVLPFESEGAHFSAVARDAGSGRRGPRIRRWLYDAREGLRVHQDDEGERE